MRACEVSASEINETAVVRTVSASNDCDGCLHVGARCPLWHLSAGRGQWPLLVGVLTDESGQDFHHRWVVSRGVAGDPLQGVDAADPHVEFVGAELFDRFGVAVGHLALLGDLKGSPSHPVVLGGKDQRPSSENARAECQ